MTLTFFGVSALQGGQHSHNPLQESVPCGLMSQGTIMLTIEGRTQEPEHQRKPFLDKVFREPFVTMAKAPECQPQIFLDLFRTRQIGANPERSDLLNFRGPDRRKFGELCVLLFFPRKPTKCTQNPGLVNHFSATLRGQLNWTGPIANGSDSF